LKQESGKRRKAKLEKHMGRRKEFVTRNSEIKYVDHYPLKGSTQNRNQQMLLHLQLEGINSKFKAQEPLLMMQHLC
jgi:hypothetical protein